MVEWTCGANAFRRRSLPVMRNRTILYLLIGLLFAIVLVGAATNAAVHGKNNPQTWLIAHQHNPVLWMVDGCAIIILLGSCLFSATYAGQSRPADETTRRIDMLTETVEELLEQNS